MRKSHKRILFVVFLFFCLTYITPIYLKYRFLYWNVEEINFLEDSDMAHESELPDVVPKIIHQTWKDEHIPKKWRTEVEFTKWLQSEFTWRLWTDGEMRGFIGAEYPWFLETFDSYPYPIQRVDAARYFILYHYGGIYLDLDVGTRKALFPLVRHSAVIPRTKPIGFSNDVMVFAKNHPFLHLMIHNLEKYKGWYGSHFLTVMCSTGPIFLDMMFAEYENKSEIRVLKHHNYGNNPGQSFFTHKIGNTWHEKDDGVFMWIYGHSYILLGFFGISGILAITSWIRNRKRRISTLEKKL